MVAPDTTSEVHSGKGYILTITVVTERHSHLYPYYLNLGALQNRFIFTFPILQVIRCVSQNSFCILLEIASQHVNQLLIIHILFLRWKRAQRDVQRVSMNPVIQHFSLTI